MKTLKTLGGLSIYFLFLGLTMALVFHKEAGLFIDSLLNSDEQVLVGLFNRIGVFFSNADAWNLIFIVLFLVAFTLLFFMIDQFFVWIFDLIKKKWSKLSFIRSAWFYLTFHKVITVITLFVVFVVGANGFITWLGNRNTAGTLNDIEGKHTVLLLGTSKMLSSGAGENLYYTYRIDACKELWENEKVDKFLISGDRTIEENYDETRDMKNDLMAFGVPESKIMLDTAGFRTLDSVLRLRSVFGVDDIIVVSQKFHVLRGLFLSWFYGVQATGYNAAGTATKAMVIRETLAKPKVILDLFFFNMQPKVGNFEYRESFQVTTDLHVILIVVLFAGLITVLYGMGKTFETQLSI